MRARYILFATVLACGPEGPGLERAENDRAALEQRYGFGYADWDTNRDGRILRSEFDRGLARVVERWDRDGDNLLSVAELADGLFTAWDLDGNGRLSRREWNERFFQGGIAGWSDFAMWDQDGDQQVSRQEYATGWAEGGLFGLWDADADDRLSTEELGTGLFDAWDEDIDADVELDEWGWS